MVRELLDAVIVKNQVAGALEALKIKAVPSTRARSSEAHFARYLLSIGFQNVAPDGRDSEWISKRVSRVFLPANQAIVREYKSCIIWLLVLVQPVQHFFR